MNDIDFDELDRAVNSLNSDNNVPSPKPDVTNDQQSFVAKSSPLAGRRSVGQFMDVVHPSSNMRPSRPIPERSNFSNNKDARTVSTPTATNNPTPTTTTSGHSASNSWPDPIDYAANNSMSKDDQDEDADINRISEEIAKTLDQDQTLEETPDSPFISGTKVEKRPLGAFSNDVPTVEAVTPEFKPYHPDEITMPPAKSDDTPLPAELDENLLSIEASNANDAAVVNLSSAAEPISKAEAAVTASAGVDASLINRPAASASISQQYTERPSTGDQTNGAIYDSNSYHNTPLKRPKKKSGWLWVIWILLLLVVGAGAGAAVYFFVLPLF